MLMMLTVSAPITGDAFLLLYRTARPRPAVGDTTLTRSFRQQGRRLPPLVHASSSSDASGDEKEKNLPDDSDDNAVQSDITPATLYLDADAAPLPVVTQAVVATGMATAACWMVVSCQLLSFHPEFVASTAWHNVLTAAQALGFALPLWTGLVTTLAMAAQRGGWRALEQVQMRRLNLAALALNIWLACVVRYYYPHFGFGLDLLPHHWGKRLSVLHVLAAGVSWGIWKATVRAMEIYETPLVRTARGVLADVCKVAPTQRGGNTTAPLFATATVGFAVNTVLPLIAPYPLATVPSILGKRLARPMAGFYALATVASFVLKQAADGDEQQDDNNEDKLSPSLLPSLTPLRRGLWIASAAHVVLLVAKVAGVDGGGLWLPGAGLVQNYPALCAVPVAAALSLIPHVAVLLTGWK